MPAVSPGPDLRDIHLPPPPSWWPPAPGWWLLAIVLGVAVVLGTRWLLREWRARRRRRAVRAELERIAARHAARPDPVRCAAEVSRLLRRASLLLDRRAAALQGEAWLDFLDAQGGGHGFRDGAGRVLLDAPYRRQAHVDADGLIALTRIWIRRVFSRHRHDDV
jgi:hypothetical protein